MRGRSARRFSELVPSRKTKLCKARVAGSSLSQMAVPVYHSEPVAGYIACILLRNRTSACCRLPLLSFSIRAVFNSFMLCRFAHVFREHLPRSARSSWAHRHLKLCLSRRMGSLAEGGRFFRGALRCWILFS